jgi:hypothetical protein
MAKLDISDSNSIFQNILIIIVIGVIAYLIYYMYSGSTQAKEQMATVMDTQAMSSQNMPSQPMMQRGDSKIDSVNYKMMGKAGGMENPVMNKMETLPKGGVVGEERMEHFSSDMNYQAERNLTSFPKEQLTAEELLPQDNSSLWAQVNPSGVGSLKDRSFLQAGYNIGINTVGQTLRNANLQLRSEPPCPQVVVSPWLQSTIESDTSRKPFEIGGCQ